MLDVAVRHIDLLESCVLLAAGAAKRVEEIAPFPKVVDSCESAIQGLHGLIRLRQFKSIELKSLRSYYASADRSHYDFG